MKKQINSCSECYWGDSCPYAGDNACEDFYSLMDDGTDETFYENDLRARVDDYAQLVEEMDS